MVNMKIAFLFICWLHSLHLSLATEAPTLTIGSDEFALPFTSRLYGSIHQTAYYFADLAIGGPEPQRQSVIADTGSSVLAFGCEDCEKCGQHIDPSFDRSASSTVESYSCDRSCNSCSSTEPICTYSISYIEGSSLMGNWYEDTVWLGHTEGSPDLSVSQQKELNHIEALQGTPTSPIGFPVDVPFGCHKEETHLFVDQGAAGILGLEAWSSHGPPTFIKAVLDDLYRKAEANSPKDIKNVTTDLTRPPSSVSFSLPLQGFALCLSEKGGVMGIGAPNWQYHRTGNKTLEHGKRRLSDEDMYQLEEVSVLPSALMKIRGPTKHKEGSIPLGAPKRRLPSRRMNLRGLKEDNGSSGGGAGDGFSTTSKFTDAFGEVQWVDVVTESAYHVVVSQFQIGDKIFALHHDRLRVEGSDGMVALVDSGTTLTYLPAPLYTHLLLEIEEHVGSHIGGEGTIPYGIGEEERVMVMSVGNQLNVNFRPDALPVSTNTSQSSPPPQLRHVSGESYSSLQEIMQNYLQNVTLATTRMEELPQTTASDRRHLQAALYRHLEETEKVMSKLQSLKEHHETEGPPSGSNGSIRSIPRLTRQSNLPPVEGETVLDFMSEHPSAHRRHAQQVKKVESSEEECWDLPNGEADLALFPDIIVRFAGDAEVTWHPKSYLYAKGSDNLRCLSLTPQGIESSSRTDATTSNTVDLEIDGKEAVLGSSFFIGQDVIFDVGADLYPDTADDEVPNPRIGFVSADCPSFDLSVHRAKSFVPADKEEYSAKLAA